MYVRRKMMDGVVSCVLLMGLIGLSGCESTTGQSARQMVSDESITAAVQTKLTMDSVSNFPRIDVDTERGVVNLTGIVQTDSQRVQATRLALEVDGVTRVNNYLLIPR